MDKNLRIAGDKSISDWLRLKVKLEENFENRELWEIAYTFLEKRLQSRYLEPIKAIENNSNVEGEGFSVVAILCSLLEALESFYQGKTYRKPTTDAPLNTEKEYYRSQPIFVSFLENRAPFSHFFSKDNLANDFYENVRCAILHEAATRNGWKVKIDTKQLIEQNENQTIINRALFSQAVGEYLNNYKDELMLSNELKTAFIYKFDSICETS